MIELIILSPQRYLLGHPLDPHSLEDLVGQVDLVDHSRRVDQLGLEDIRKAFVSYFELTTGVVQRTLRSLEAWETYERETD